MRFDFAKLHGLGNDFVFIDNLQNSISLDEGQVKLICDRHFGIGADGVILVDPSPRDECAAYMHYINSDGTLAQMCGNGVRCFAKYLVDRGIVDSQGGSFVADTLAGPRPIDFEVDRNGLMTKATVDMGEPVLDPANIPVRAALDSTAESGVEYVGRLVIDSPWGDFSFVAVSMGNPHAICFVDDFAKLPDDAFVDSANKSLESFNVDVVGKFFESNPAFPEKSNIEFATIVDDGINMRVYERGCAETYACGTGACATSVAATLAGLSGRANTVHLKGGDLLINWSEDNHVYMTGPAEEAFTGEMELA